MESPFAKDLGASLLLCLIAMPLNVAVALACGADPLAGILSGVIAGIVVGAIAGCSLQVSGPAVGLVAMIWYIVDAHGLFMLGPIVLGAGMIQILLSTLRMTHWFRAVSPSVFQGMLAGIGTLIFANQFQVLLGEVPKSTGIENLLELPRALGAVLFAKSGGQSALVGLFALFVMLCWQRVFTKPRFAPALLVGPVVAVGVSFFYQLEIPYVQVSTDGLPQFSFLSREQILGLFSFSVLGSMLALSFVATSHSLVTAKILGSGSIGQDPVLNREIFAQGAGNVICGALGLLPISGTLLRGEVNPEAGATGRLSTILHGVWVTIFLLFFSSLLNYLPVSALAALLVYGGLRLMKFSKALGSTGRSLAESVSFFATFLLIVVFDLLTGIVLGLLCSASLFRSTTLGWSGKPSETAGGQKD